MPAMEDLQSRLQEILDVLSPQELRTFRDILKKVDEVPRLSPLQLELEGGSTSGLARLLAKHYYLAAPRVVTKVLRQLPRADLLQRWQSHPAADSQGERGLAQPRGRFRAGGQRRTRDGVLGERGVWPRGAVGRPREWRGGGVRGGAGASGEEESEPGGCGRRGTKSTCCGRWEPGGKRAQESPVPASDRVSSRRVAIGVC